MKAEVVEWMNRYFLKVNGITMVRDGDLCRSADKDFIGTYWTKESLELAAKRINDSAIDTTPPHGVEDKA